MAGSESTPDFSWLHNQKNDSDKSPLKDAPERDSPPEQVAPAEPVIEPNLVATPAEKVEHPVQQPGVVQQEALASSPDSESDSDADPHQQDVVKPTAETWVPDAPPLVRPAALAFGPPIVYPSPGTEEQMQYAEEFEKSPSVFDDESDESFAPVENNNEDPTLIMPGRELSPTENAILNSSNSLEDLTVVLPPESVPQAEVATDHLSDSPDAHNEDQQNIPAHTTSGDAKAATAELPPTSTAGTTESPSLSWILLASYASAMTLIALALLLRSGGNNAKPHHLESLPDVVPETVGELSYVPINASLPLGHTLKIGEKQRFGNIEVEPLRIVQLPLEFTHYSGESKLTRPATQPVLMLHLRFSNVSKSQQIAPLDGDLLLRWVTKSEQNREYSNQYLYSSQSEEEIPIYRHSKTSDWDLKDQRLGQVLAPGESYETFIPSTESLPEQLPENLHWRLQFRKGYSPNGGGVTTLVDVAFRKSDVQTVGETNAKTAG